jgi:DNA-binding transcriptional regulator LsrR (DeoR family)
MTQKDIGTLFSISKHSVYETLRRQKDAGVGKVAADCDKYENAWQEIESAISLTYDIPSASEVISKVHQEQ